ncbi:MAG: phage major capsid protein [Caenispirillum sp.]|nr:phage major capsid protein [Caenispirillum sp.]
MNQMMTSRRAITAYAGPATAADNPQTPGEIATALQKAFHDFQSANDDALKGKADAATVENINAEITRLQKAMDDATKAIGRMTVGGGAGDGDTDIARNAARFMTMARGQTARVGDAADVEAYRAYRDAFSAAVRGSMNMEHLSNDIRAAMQVGSDPAGGYFVPTEMSNEMERRIHDTSPMRQIARVVTIGTNAWEAPWKTSKGTSGGWVGERQSRQATGTAAVGIQRIEVHEQYAYPEVTQQMLDDATMNVEAFIVEDTEEEMARTENTAFVSGNGVMKPKGFLGYAASAVTTSDADGRDWGKLQYLVSGAAATFPTLGSGASNPDAFINVITALHPNYRAGAVWTMNRATEATIRKLKDAEGRYLIGMGSIEGGLAFTLMGHPIVNLEDMPDVAADAFPIAFGDFRRGYMIVDRAGFRLLRDPYTNKPYVGYYITKRTGGDVRNFDAIKLLKISE